MRTIKTEFVLKTGMTDDELDEFLVELKEEFEDHLVSAACDKNEDMASEEVVETAWMDITSQADRVRNRVSG